MRSLRRGRLPWLATFVWLYVAWTLVPVVAAVLFSFNRGKSRSVFQGFSLRWWTGDPNLSLFHDPAYLAAIEQSLRLAALDVAIALPLGVALALFLTRWRGRGATVGNVAMLIPLITPELVLAVALFFLLSRLFKFVPLGTAAQAVGQVTFSISFVVIIVRGRLLTIGLTYEEAAADLGATGLQALRLVLLPMLYPAIFASAVVVFALSIDDFVVTQYLSAGASSISVPMLIYGAARTAATPALNALAAVMIAGTVVVGAAGAAIYRVWTREEAPTRSRRNVRRSDGAARVRVRMGRA